MRSPGSSSRCSRRLRLPSSAGSSGPVGRACSSAAGAALHGCERILAVASGVDEVTARELALKIEEGAHVPVTPLGIEKVLHGHLPACDDRTGLVLLRLDARAGEQRDV